MKLLTYVFTLLSALTLACDDPVVNVIRCGVACYAGPKPTVGVGPCTWGVTVCDNTGMVTSCTSTVPKQEQCDGVDNDCNGVVDDYVTMVGFPCYNAPTCTPGVQFCVDGRLVCRGPSPDKVEICNSVDDDCNELVDDIPIKPCYTHPDLTTIRYPPCSYGIEYCGSDNAVMCSDTTPKQEICNGVDDDCDGAIDESASLDFGTVDIVVAIDHSGSNDPWFHWQREALNIFSLTYASEPRVQWALISFPRSETEMYTLMSRLGSQVHFSNALNSMLFPGPGADEPSMNVIHDVATERIPVGFRLSSYKILVMFADERPQSDPQYPVSFVDVQRAAHQIGLHLIIFSSAAYRAEWASYPNTAFTPSVYRLDVPAVEIVRQLNEAFQAVCQ